MTSNDYACSECDGHGEVECPCCKADLSCAACDGTGLDSEKLDVKSFRAAEIELLNKGMTWEWWEGGKVLGRMSDGGRVAYRDFPPK